MSVTHRGAGNTNAYMLSDINTSIGAERKWGLWGQNATSGGVPHCLISLILSLHSPFIAERQNTDYFQGCFTLSPLLSSSFQIRPSSQAHSEFEWTSLFWEPKKKKKKSHLFLHNSTARSRLTCTPGPPDRNVDWSWWGSAGEDQARISPTCISERGDKTRGTRARWGSWRLRFWCCLHIYLQAGGKSFLFYFIFFLKKGGDKKKQKQKEVMFHIWQFGWYQAPEQLDC